MSPALPETRAYAAPTPVIWYLARTGEAICAEHAPRSMGRPWRRLSAEEQAVLIAAPGSEGLCCEVCRVRLIRSRRPVQS